MKGVLQWDCLLFEVTGLWECTDHQPGLLLLPGFFLVLWCMCTHPAVCFSANVSTLKKVICVPVLFWNQKTWKGLREPISWLVIGGFCMRPMLSQPRHMAVSLRSPRSWTHREYGVIWARFLTERTRGCDDKEDMKVCNQLSCTSWWLMPPCLLRSTASFIQFAGENGTE